MLVAVQQELMGCQQLPVVALRLKLPESAEMGQQKYRQGNIAGHLGFDISVLIPLVHIGQKVA
jgi:hypothetical protein